MSDFCPDVIGIRKRGGVGNWRISRDQPVTMKGVVTSRGNSGFVDKATVSDPSGHRKARKSQAKAKATRQQSPTQPKAKVNTDATITHTNSTDSKSIQEQAREKVAGMSRAERRAIVGGFPW